MILLIEAKNTLKSLILSKAKERVGVDVHWRIGAGCQLRVIASTVCLGGR